MRERKRRSHALAHIQDTDLNFEHKPVRTLINRNQPEIQLAGLKIGPYEEGKEYDIPYWIANELEKAGIAKLRDEELLDTKKLDKTLWKEKIQQTRQITHLEQDFYPRLRRFLQSLRKQASTNPDKAQEYRKATDAAQDIVNIRIRKIIALASSPEQTNQTLDNDLAKEEHTLYDQLYTTINEWKNNILKELNQQ